MFEEYVGKKVRVVKTDNFSKYGILIEVLPAFIRLELDDGRVEYIALAAISSLVEVPR